MAAFRRVRQLRAASPNAKFCAERYIERRTKSHQIEYSIFGFGAAKSPFEEREFIETEFIDIEFIEIEFGAVARWFFADAENFCRSASSRSEFDGVSAQQSA